MIAIDQYNNIVYVAKYPRKELLEHHQKKHAEKIFDSKNGVTKHIGYIIAGHWYIIYKRAVK
jgi:hypothetical protein